MVSSFSRQNPVLCQWLNASLRTLGAPQEYTSIQVNLDFACQVHVDVGEPADLVVDVPNHSGPQSAGFHAGMAVNCVCAADAIRVLHRSPASSAAESG
jgi:hypothetical protein